MDSHYSDEDPQSNRNVSVLTNLYFVCFVVSGRKKPKKSTHTTLCLLGKVSKKSSEEFTTQKIDQDANFEKKKQQQAKAFIKNKNFIRNNNTHKFKSKKKKKYGKCNSGHVYVCK